MRNTYGERCEQNQTVSDLVKSTISFYSHLIVDYVGKNQQDRVHVNTSHKIRYIQQEVEFEYKLFT